MKEGECHNSIEVTECSVPITEQMWKETECYVIYCSSKLQIKPKLPILSLKLYQLTVKKHFCITFFCVSNRDLLPYCTYVNQPNLVLL